MKKIIFIDRDGVINRDPGGWTEHSYVTKWSDFHFLPNSIKALRKLKNAGYDIVVISNQGGVSKGYCTKEALNDINKKMLEKIEKNGARIKKTYYCPHQDSDSCDCRKPETGLFRRAEKELGVCAAGKFFIGDGKTDVEAGARMGMKTILVLSGKTNLDKIKSWDIRPDYIFDDLDEAVEFVTAGSKKDGR